MRKIFILVPSLIPTGPIKGAVALCNSFVNRSEVTLVALKPSASKVGAIDPRVRVINLQDEDGWKARIRCYRSLLDEAGGASEVSSLSMGLSADVVNFFVRRHAETFASIRGHLHRTYRIDFGFFGVAIAFFHYWVMARLNHVVAMTDHMANQFTKIAWTRPHVIGNFVDEEHLEPYRQATLVDAAMTRFVFVGRLSPLKRPDLLIEAVCQLLDQGIFCSLDIFGDGPLMDELVAMVAAQGAEQSIHFHGHLENPWTQAADAHCLVLPSLTEGISRAIMEALYLGIPCVLRDVDSNSEVVQTGVNGALFSEDKDLVQAMKSTAEIGIGLPAPRPILLTDSFRQESCAERYFQLLQES